MAGMTDEELKALCKTNIRTTSTAYDGMIESLIGAAKEDISASCDVEFDPESETECQAVVMYVKGNYPYEPDEKSWNRYQQMLNVIGTRKIQ